MPDKGSVCVAWLDPGEVMSDFCNSITDLFRIRQDVIPGRVNIRCGAGIVRGRNVAISQFLSESPDEWMLWIDSDMAFTIADFDLVYDAVHAKRRPIVGGLCFGQQKEMIGPFPPLFPTIFHQRENGAYEPMWDYPDSELVHCDATGSAFLMIHRSVLEKIRDDVGLGEWSWYHEYPNAADKWTGEDIAFCELVKASGFPIKIHTGAKIDHVKGPNYVLNEEMYRLLHNAIQRPVEMQQ